MFERWHEGSNCLVLLSVPDLNRLLEVLDVAHLSRVPYSCFTEPDVNDEITAATIAPHRAGTSLGAVLASLPLQGKELAMS